MSKKLYYFFKKLLLNIYYQLFSSSTFDMSLDPPLIKFVFNFYNIMTFLIKFSFYKNLVHFFCIYIFKTRGLNRFIETKKYIKFT